MVDARTFNITFFVDILLPSWIFKYLNNIMRLFLIIKLFELQTVTFCSFTMFSLQTSINLSFKLASGIVSHETYNLLFTLQRWKLTNVNKKGQRSRPNINRLNRDDNCNCFIKMHSENNYFLNCVRR